MAITILTYPSSTDLTTLAELKAALQITVSTYDTLLSSKIRAASDAILSHCGREFARAKVEETVKGYGDTRLMLSLTPISSVVSVAQDSSPITDYVVENAKVGFLYRRAGWDWTAQLGWSLSGTPIPGSEEAVFAATYYGGYLLPGDDMSSKTTISAANGDNSLNDSAAGFPLLAPGDRIRISGFATAANNGAFTVVSRTASKVVVSGGTLATEVAGPSVSVAVRSLPYDVEEACIETAKAWYLQSARDPAVASRSVGDLSVSYRAPSIDAGESLPIEALKRLRSWVRIE